MTLPTDTMANPAADTTAKTAADNPISSETIEITLVNQSSDDKKLTVLIFQRSGAGKEGSPVAWRVIQNLGRGWSHTFAYDFAVQAGARDSDGNTSPLLPAMLGQRFSVHTAGSDECIAAVGDALDPREVEIVNDLPKGAIDACVYRGGRLLATRAGLAPGQKARLDVNDTLSIGVVSQWDIKPGQILSAAILSSVQTQIDLFGLTGSATIVITGGGAGRASTPFQFTLSG